MINYQGRTDMVERRLNDAVEWIWTACDEDPYEMAGALRNDLGFYHFETIEYLKGFGVLEAIAEDAVERAERGKEERR